MNARTARNLHDELGQTLTALRMDTLWLRRNRDDKNAPFSDKVQTMTGLIDSMIKSVQQISSELRPRILTDLGLVAALEWQANEFQKRYEISCRIVYEGKENTYEKTAIALFRIFQEALTNIARHAQATQVDVTIHFKPDTTIMIITDNGRGIKPEEITDRNSLGIMGMEERIAYLNGRLTIQGAQNQGTRIEITLPLDPTLRAEAAL